MLVKYYIYHSNEKYETCYYIIFKNDSVDNKIKIKIKDILSLNGYYNLRENPTLIFGKEIGPRCNFKTSWCNTMLEIFKKCGINNVETIEYSIKYKNDNKKIKFDKMLFTDYINNYFKNNYKNKLVKDDIKYVELEKYNLDNNLGFDAQDITNYNKMYYKLGRYPTDVELYDLSQCNSEHARHWYFKGILNNQEFSLFDKIKSCYNPEIHTNSLISFYDNASVIKGSYVKNIKIDTNLKYDFKMIKKHYSYKAETHNFPTGISPFPGAATGSGGRIRDILCVGTGGDIIAGTAGYCVGDIFNKNNTEYSFLYNTPINILIEASNGASDYGNKIGEPLIQGFTRSYRKDFDKKRIEWLKPIMFSGGIGCINEKNINKKSPSNKDLIVRIGGPAYRIGIGGGSASSRTQSIDNIDSDFNAVQRGDPLVANKLVQFLRKINELQIIISIHDQGSGGMANVTREICEDKGATIYLDKVLLGDNTLTSLEKWVAEYQEQITFLIKEENLDFAKKIAVRENLSLVVVGFVDTTDILKVYKDETKSEIVVELPIEQEFPRKKFVIEAKKEILIPKNDKLINFSKLSLFYMLEKVFSLVDVGSKQFLTNKVDRSVSGLIVQQQCIGPFHLPLSNFSAVKNSFDTETILVSAIGEQPIKGVNGNVKNMVALTVGEMLTNIIWCQIDSIKNINCVANWMWASIDKNNGWLLNEAVDTLVYYSNELGFSINGGKDSLSMKVKNNNEDIDAPNTLVLSGYTSIHGKSKLIKPNLKGANNLLILVRFDNFKGSLGNSAFSRFFNCNQNVPNFIQLDKFKNIFNIIQKLIKNGIILSGHDISDGGLLTTLTEMSFSSIYGINIDIRNIYLMEEYFFSEELGLVFEIDNSNFELVSELFSEKNICIENIGSTTIDKEVIIKYNGNIVLDEKNDDIRYEWQKTSYMLEMQQANKENIEQEIKNCYSLIEYEYVIPEKISKNLIYYLTPYYHFKMNKPRVAIMRTEGSNGDREMAYSFMEVGFDVYDVTIEDIKLGKINLRKFRGIAFVGGFSYGDVLGSAYGWYNTIKYNEVIKKEFDCFYNRSDTFSLGVCNGCQLMSLLGWIPKGIKLKKNNSERFESRWSKVKILSNNNIFLKNLEDLVFGIYTAHGEGRIDSDISYDDEIFPVRYLDQENNITEKYPFNPNGSSLGKAAISSNCGRHLAIMPHPERTILGWQMPFDFEYKYTPWFTMFRNAYDWCAKETN